MKEYKIKLEPTVELELEIIGQTILTISQSKSTAYKYMNYIYQQIQTLSYFPERYVSVSKRDSNIFIRKFNIKKYSIFYYVLDNTVWVIDIIQSSSKKASYYK